MGSRLLDAVIVVAGAFAAVSWLVGYARWQERLWREQADARALAQANRVRDAFARMERRR